MHRHHEYELTRRLEAVAWGSGDAVFQKWELRIWYNQERVSKGIYRDIMDRYTKLAEDDEHGSDVLVFSDGDRLALMHVAHVRRLSEYISNEE